MLKEPLYLWQAPLPDGGNVEQRVGRGGGGRGSEGEREKRKVPTLVRRTNGWRSVGQVFPSAPALTWQPDSQRTQAGQDEGKVRDG